MIVSIVNHRTFNNISASSPNKVNTRNIKKNKRKRMWHKVYLKTIITSTVKYQKWIDILKFL